MLKKLLKKIFNRLEASAEELSERKRKLEALRRFAASRIPGFKALSCTSSGNVFVEFSPPLPEYKGDSNYLVFKKDGVKAVRCFAKKCFSELDIWEACFRAAAFDDLVVSMPSILRVFYGYGTKTLLCKGDTLDKILLLADVKQQL